VSVYFNVDAASFMAGTIKLDGSYMFNNDPEKMAAREIS
jgi:hypothetical protein